MKGLRSGLLVVLAGSLAAAGAVGCKKDESSQSTPSAASAAASNPAASASAAAAAASAAAASVAAAYANVSDDDFALPEDFADETKKAIDAKNYKKELDKIEKDLAAPAK